MTIITIFLTGVAVSGAISIGVVVYLHPHLKSILTELCGTAGRARFWVAFANVTLLLVPLIFAMSYRPEMGPATLVVLEIGSALKWALIGLAVSVVSLGMVIGSFIPGHRSAK